MKRVLFLPALILYGVTVFAAGSSEGAAGQPRVVVSAPGVFPIVKEKITLTGFIPSIGFIDDMATNASVVALEEKTNVHIEWIESSKVDAKNKLSILLAGGDYPDVIQGALDGGLSNLDIIRYGQQGIFIPINDLIEKYAFYMKDLFTALPFVEQAIKAADGNIYGFPVVLTDDYHMTMRQKLWINRTWLDNLKLKMPKTLEDFYNVMKAFKEQDANANGNKNDEIPLTGAQRSQEDVAMWIMNSFVVAGGPDESGDPLLNCYEFIVEGKVIFNADKDEFRDGLRFIHKMYSEDLIDVAALTQSRDQIKPLVDGGDASRIGAAASHHPGNFANITDSMDERFHQYVALPPLKGPKGNQTTPWFIDNVIKPGMLVITDACKYPEVAFRWADYMFSLEFELHERGIEGVHWRKVDAGEGLIGLNGKPAKYAYIKVLTPEDNAQINLGPGWTYDLKNEFAKAEGFSYEEFLYNATLTYDPYKTARFPYSTTAIASELIDEYNDLRKMIHTFVGESIDRFIIGDMDIEKDWDIYKARLRQIGLQRYLEILSKSYSAS